MKLTLYLFKAHVQDFGQCLKPQTAKRNYKDITNKQRDDVEDVRIYAVDKEPTVPKWTNFMAGYASSDELNNLQNRAASALIVWRVQTADGPRIFAASHGMAYSLIDTALIEQNFGLRATLNSIVPHKIKSLDYKNISARGTQRKEAAGSATNIANFGFEDDSEVLKAVTGRAVDDELGFVLSGADSLKITIKDLQFAQLNDVAQKAYDRFMRTIYKENFDFIDHFENERNPLTIAELDHELVVALSQPALSPYLSVTYPEHMPYDECDHFKVKVHNAEDTFDEIEVGSLHAFLRDSAGTLDIDTLKSSSKILGLDDAGEPKAAPKNVYSFLGFELTHGGAKYALSGGKWYKIDESFVTKLDDWLNQHVLPASLPLKPWGEKFSESEYMAAFASEADYLLLDKEFFRPKGHGKVEMADLYHKPTNRLVGIKKLKCATSMSHLLIQAAISADLLRENDQRAWDFLLTRVQQKWPGVHKEQLEHNLGYVIAIAANNDLPANLPIFSKIALKKAARHMKKLGFKVEIQQIST